MNKNALSYINNLVGNEQPNSYKGMYLKMNQVNLFDLRT